MSINWVMTSAERKPLPLPAEKFLFSAESVNLSLFPSAPGAPLTQTPQPNTEYTASGGSVFLSNKRIVWISSTSGPATRKSADGAVAVLKSLSVAHSSALDSRLHQPWFGASYWEALVVPAAEGGLDSPHVLRLTFKDRGAGEFVGLVQEMHARLGTESGRGTPAEDLPIYTPPDQSRGSTTATPGPSGLSNVVSAQQAESTQSPTEDDLDAAQVARTAEEDERIRETRQGEMRPPPPHQNEAPPGYDV